MTDQQDDRAKRVSLLQVAHSVLAALFGVQSERNRQRDFERGSGRTFVVAGLLGGVLFVLAIVLVVKLVLRAATS
ncbi:MAG TPA: DUF2970 domain-containing protein [Gammaproteobacteria bacterium]|nr:DUF2970 domain-containing protein [Gammaproteobacteria bacterium]